MAFYRRYSFLLGLFALILVMVLLLSTTGSAFSPGVTFIDSELHRSSGEEAYVRTKMDLGAAEHLNAFPREIGSWTGYDYDTSGARESLGADVVLLRGYDRPGLYQPIFFLIMQAKTEASFHPPPVCYGAQGYRIQEEAKEQVLVADVSWAEATSSMSIPLRKMVVFKESSGEITERRVVLYCYVKGNQLTSDAVTMVSVEGLAPIEGSYDGILDMEKDFIAQAVPYMFEPTGEEKWNPLALRLAESGVGGYFAIVLLLLIPSAITIYPRTRRGRGSLHESGRKNEAH